jgi:GNAT superfamily N-acetyltransferase
VNRSRFDLDTDVLVRPVLVRPVSRRDLDALMRVCLEWPGAPAARDPGLLRTLLEQALSDDDATLYLAVTRLGPTDLSGSGLSESGPSESGPSKSEPESEIAVGFAHVTFQARPVRLGWRATIEELHVVPGFVNRSTSSVETVLLEAIVRECRARGDVIALYLLTQPDLEPRQLEFYDSLGFRERGRDVLIWNGTLASE